MLSLDILVIVEPRTKTCVRERKEEREKLARGGCCIVSYGMFTDEEILTFTISGLG
jgi:hypothetical protein